MNIEDLKRELDYFSSEDTGIIIYFILKNGEESIVKMADIDAQDALPELKEHFCESISTRIIEKEDIVLLNLSEADERGNVIYKYDLDDFPEELTIMRNILEGERPENFNFEEDDISQIKGYLILMGDHSHRIILYKQHYGISLIKRDSFLIFKEQERFVKLDEDLIRLDNNFQFFYFEDELYIKDLDVLERFFGFYEAIKREAVLSIENIEESGILEDVDVLMESVDDLTFARKLTKIRTGSPVLGKIPVDQIIKFSKEHPGTADKFKYNEDESKIRLDTKISQKLFVKLLDDSYLRSELTDMYYDSLAKDPIKTD